MSNPVIADNKPKKVSLKKGEEYAFCVCGRSNNQPFCDGSHKGTGMGAGVCMRTSACVCDRHCSPPPDRPRLRRQTAGPRILLV